MRHSYIKNKNKKKNARYVYLYIFQVVVLMTASVVSKVDVTIDVSGKTLPVTVVMDPSVVEVLLVRHPTTGESHAAYDMVDLIDGLLDNPDGLCVVRYRSAVGTGYRVVRGIADVCWMVLHPYPDAGFVLIADTYDPAYGGDGWQQKAMKVDRILGVYAATELSRFADTSLPLGY